KVLSCVLSLTDSVNSWCLCPSSLGLPLGVVCVGGGFLALCLLAARLGVARPGVDVFFIIVNRPGRKDHELPGLTLSGVVMQAISNLGVFPTVALTSPATFYRPEIG